MGVYRSSRIYRIVRNAWEQGWKMDWNQGILESQEAQITERGLEQHWPGAATELNELKIFLLSLSNDFTI